MPYDPQRSHRRPRLGDDGPAPIDALLDHAESPEQTESADERPAVVAPAAKALSAETPSVRVPVVAAPEDEPVFVDEVELEVVSSSSRRPRVVVLAVALLVALLVLFWARRRR